MVVNAYERYFRADAVFSDVPRKGALVLLIADSEAGNVTYRAAVTFFPHRDEEDFAVSWDAYLERELYSGRGRRSRKKEAAWLEQLPEIVDGMAGAHGAAVFWDEPLTEERRG